MTNSPIWDDDKRLIEELQRLRFQRELENLARGEREQTVYRPVEVVNPPSGRPVINYPDLSEQAKRRWVLGLNLFLFIAIMHPKVNGYLERIIRPATPPITQPSPIIDIQPLAPAPSLPIPNAPQEGLSPSPQPSPQPNPQPNLQPNPQPGTLIAPPPSQNLEAPLIEEISDQALVNRVISYARTRGWEVREGRGRINIFYVQGLELNNKPNGERANSFDDLRLAIEVNEGAPRLLGKWEATTKPGAHYINNPMNSKGTACLKTDHQFKAWTMGFHRQNLAHPALIQIGGPVTVIRKGAGGWGQPGEKFGGKGKGREDTGYFGINQHGVVGKNLNKNGVGNASAGCLVARNWNGHIEFISLLRNDPDFINNSSYVWRTAVIPQRVIVKYSGLLP